MCARRSLVRSPANQATAHGRPLCMRSMTETPPAAAAVAARNAAHSATTIAALRGVHVRASSRLAASR